MEVKTYQIGDHVIKQGDDGFELYIVSEGRLKCTKLFSGQKEETFLKNYNVGEVFGELSLFYNTPRAASITSDTESILFSLDRATFNFIVKQSAVKRRERFEQFLDQIEIFQSMDAYEKGKISDVLTAQTFKKGENIITQGDVADRFFLILQGQAEAIKVTDGVEQVVFKYGEGEGL
jgi:cAMP-dependent protein kinase regulator